jgi:hypothetical protein
LNHLRDMLAAGGEHQQRLGFQVHGFGQQQGTQLLSEWCAARFAGGDHGMPRSAQAIDHPGVLGAFSGTIDALEADEAAARHGG